MAYSKRSMAQDQVEVMKHFGFQKFAVVGHDRGGRAAHRMALDYPEVLTKLVILDIVPTYKLYQNITQEFATVFYHWFLLVQPAPFPETLVANSAEYFLKSLLYRLGGEAYSEKTPDWIGEAAYKLPGCRIHRFGARQSGPGQKNSMSASHPLGRKGAVPSHV
jgi:haloacetate dehalogenase